MVRRAGRADAPVSRQRAHDAARVRHGRPALRALAAERAPADQRAARRGRLHGEGGRGRLPPRRDGRLRDRGRAVGVEAAAARLSPLHRRLADDPDPRDRADGRRLGEPEAAGVVPGLGRGVGDRRLPDLLSRHDQHPARPPVGRPARPRADALVRGEPLEDPPEAANPGLVPVPVHSAEDRGAGLRRRRDHRRAALVDPGRSRRSDPQLQPVLHHLARRASGRRTSSRRRSGSSSSPSSRSPSGCSSAVHRSTSHERRLRPPSRSPGSRSASSAATCSRSTGSTSTCSRASSCP